MKRRDFVFSLSGLAVALNGKAGKPSEGKPGFLSPEMVTSLPETTSNKLAAASNDWLISPPKDRARVYRSDHAHEIIMTNGLIRRCWRLQPNAVTVEFDNLMTGAAMLRGVKPEACIELDGQEYAIGGLLGQPNYAYLNPEWLDQMTADPKAFRCTGFEIGETKAPFPWKRTQFSGNQPWPAPGASLTFRYEPPDSRASGITVLIHYEMFDGIPVLAKWVSINNASQKTVRLNRLVSEILAVVEYEAVPALSAPGLGGIQHPDLHVESNYHYESVHWDKDPQYTTQVDYYLRNPCLLQVHPHIGPDVDIGPGETFEGYKTYELVFDSTDRERKGLALRRMYRTVSPWVTENPIFMHVTSTKAEEIKKAIDQAADVGFEMVIVSFSWDSWTIPGFLNPEYDEPALLEGARNLADYAKQKGITLGIYSLLASRNISQEDNVINPKTMTTEETIFDHSPCLGSKWGIEYFRKMRSYFEKTGMGVLEHDGSYPGDFCASTRHPGHHGLEDSQWTQWKTITGFYEWCRARGIYLNIPDIYFQNGENKTAMGYREDDWSLPRAQQVIIGRQNIYDGTWRMTPSMGWMFVPLVQYHGGGAAATIEPLRDHLDVYGQILAQNMGSGVQAAYRGMRLYDSEETRAVVKKWVDFYKAHREILESDIIHVRRADGRNVDVILHVNSQLATKGFAMVFNPLNAPVTQTLTLPLYYTGLTDKVIVREQDGKARTYRLNRKHEVEIPVSIPAQGLTWFTIA